MPYIEEKLKTKLDSDERVVKDLSERVVRVSELVAGDVAVPRGDEQRTKVQLRAPGLLQRRPLVEQALRLRQSSRQKARSRKN